MIEMVSRSGEPEAMLCPALVCDTCRQQVVGRGNIVWAMRHEPRWQSSPLFVSHKGRCDLVVEAGLQSQYPISDGWLDFSAEADQFMRHLAHNADHSFADDPDGTYRIVPVIHPGKD